jgi:tetratricopeptide (TPR) repeat protein
VKVGGPRLGDDVVRQAESSYSAGDFRQSREFALQGLQTVPDNVPLLRLAGRSSLELDLDDAVPYLQKAVELAPDDPEAWRDLSLALINTGDATRAAEALGEVIRRRPNESAARFDLAHLLYALGRPDEAIALLLKVVELNATNLAALRSLVEMYRDQGNSHAALNAAHEITRQSPGDVVAKLDAAQLNLALGNYTAAATDYAQLRALDPEPEHLTYAYYGLIHVEVQRSNWRRALDHAIDATRVDRGDLTTQLLAFIAARLFGDTGRETLTQAEVEAVLTAEHLEHRRQLVESWTSQ